MSTVAVVAGFSLTNRWLLYASIMMAPAQFLSGLGNHCPSNIGFLAYSWYTQIQWFRAIQAKDLHALSMLSFNFNFVYNFSYLGGVTSGNLPMGIILGLGSAGLIAFNTAAAWTSWATNLPEGYGVYQFFFFGWRTLNSNWHTFFLVWQIGDTLLAIALLIAGVFAAIWIATKSGDDILDNVPGGSLARYPAIFIGAAFMLVGFWPLIMWTELIFTRNNIVSETDWVAVWLFVAQVGAMLAPNCARFYTKLGWRSKPPPPIISQP